MRVLEARAQLGIAVGGLFPQTQQAFGSLQYNRTSETGSPGRASCSSNSELSGNPRSGFRPAGNSTSGESSGGRLSQPMPAWLATIADYDNALVSLTADVANSYILIRTLEKTDRHCPSKRGNAKGEPEDRRGPVSVRHHLAIGCGAGQNGAQ